MQAYLEELARGSEALEVLDEAHRLLVDLVRDGAAPEDSHSLAIVRENQGIALARLGRLSEALVEFEAARDTRRTLARRFPSNPDYQRRLANTHHSLGVLLQDLGRPQPALLEYQAARELRRQLAQQFPAVPTYQQEWAHTLNDLGKLLATLGRLPEANVECEAARELQARLIERFPESPRYRLDLARTHVALARQLAQQGELESALTTYTTARDILEAPKLTLAGTPEQRHELARTLAGRGALLRRKGQWEEARKELRAAHEIDFGLASEHPAVTAYRVAQGGSECNLGAALAGEGELEAGLTWFDRAVQTLGPVLEQQPLDATTRSFLRNSHVGRAMVLDQLRRHDEAIADWSRALELGAPDEQLETQIGRATTRLRQGRLAEAIAEIEQAAPTENSSSDDCYALACFYSLASVLDTGGAQRLREQAMVWLARAVAAGFDDAAHLQSDTDLDALREREDFRELMSKLEETPSS